MSLTRNRERPLRIKDLVEFISSRTREREKKLKLFPIHYENPQVSLRMFPSYLEIPFRIGGF